MSGYVQTNQPLMLPDANYTISQADTGKLFIIGALTALRTYTLPAPAVGLRYKFILSVASGAGNNARILGPATSIFGLLSNYTAVTAISGVNPGVNLIAGTALRGDNIELVCDGTGWSLLGFSSAVGGITTS